MELFGLIMVVAVAYFTLVVIVGFIQGMLGR